MEMFNFSRCVGYQWSTISFLTALKDVQDCNEKWTHFHLWELSGSLFVCFEEGEQILKVWEYVLYGFNIICLHILLWRRQWHPTPVLLPGKSHGWRNLLAAVHGVAKSRTQLSEFTFTFHFPALEKEMATHCSVLAWRIPGTGEPGGLPSVGLHRVGHD